MHFQWASDDRWNQHVRSGRGLYWNIRHTFEQDWHDKVHKNTKKYIPYMYMYMCKSQSSQYSTEIGVSKIQIDLSSRKHTVQHVASVILQGRSSPAYFCNWIVLRSRSPSFFPPSLWNEKKVEIQQLLSSQLLFLDYILYWLLST